MGPKNANDERSAAIGVIPKPEARGTEWRKPAVWSSVKYLAKNNLKDDLVQYTREVWEPRLGRDLTSEDVRQITENLTGFFALLAQWWRRGAGVAVNSNDVVCRRS